MNKRKYSLSMLLSLKEPAAVAGFCVIQADDRPPGIHRESRQLAYRADDDTREMMRALNGGSLGRKWDYWSSSFVINRLKSRLIGCEHRVIPIEPHHHPDRFVTWSKVRILLEFMREHPAFEIVAFLDSDAFIRDEARFAALARALADAPGKHGVVSRDPIMPKNTYINTGCLILKNDAFTQDFLQTVWADAERRPRLKTEWPHEQFAAGNFVKANKDAFYICKTAVLNTPCGEIVRHCWLKDLFNEIVEDEFKSTVAGMCFKEQRASDMQEPFDVTALLDE